MLGLHIHSSDNWQEKFVGLQSSSVKYFLSGQKMFRQAIVLRCS